MRERRQMLQNLEAGDEELKRENIGSGTSERGLDMEDISLFPLKKDIYFKPFLGEFYFAFKYNIPNSSGTLVPDNLTFCNYGGVSSGRSRQERLLFLKLRYGPLHGPTSRSCGGLWPSTEGFLPIRQNSFTLNIYKLAIKK